mgnify:CR=1 FL=1
MNKKISLFALGAALIAVPVLAAPGGAKADTDGNGTYSMEEMKATGRITGPMPAPFLAYDFVPNYEMFSMGTPREAPPPEDRGQRGKRRVTPRRAEDLEAGGDLVFALRNAYGT